MKSKEKSITRTSSSKRINRRVTTSVIRLSHNLFRPDSNQWFLSYTNRYRDGMWTHGQLYLDGPNRTICFAWNEAHQVDMREIYRQRMEDDVLRETGEHTGCFTA